MTEWDRKTLLQLVDEAGKSLNASELSIARRHSLQALLNHYGNKAKSIHASRQDVLSMENQLAQILGSADCDS